MFVCLVLIFVIFLVWSFGICVFGFVFVGLWFAPFELGLRILVLFVWFVGLFCWLLVRWFGGCCFVDCWFVVSVLGMVFGLVLYLCVDCSELFGGYLFIYACRLRSFDCWFDVLEGFSVRTGGGCLYVLLFLCFWFYFGCCVWCLGLVICYEWFSYVLLCVDSVALLRCFDCWVV